MPQLYFARRSARRFKSGDQACWNRAIIAHVQQSVAEVMLSFLGEIFLKGLWAGFGFVFFATTGWCGLASIGQRWPETTPVKVCFFGEDPTKQRKVVTLAKTWTLGTGISFDFGAEPDFNSCKEQDRYDIRIDFKQPGFWSYVGNAARNVSQTQPTMNLGLLNTVNGEDNIKILKMFGHSLGFLYQEQAPGSGCYNGLNREYFKSKGWSDERIASLLVPRSAFPLVASEQVWLPPGTDDGAFMATPYDANSVMRFPVMDSRYEPQLGFRCSGAPSSALSRADHDLAKFAYPPKPGELVAKFPQHADVSLEGQLAPEHFGHVLAALYNVGAIKLKQVPIEKDKQLGAVIAQEGLAPWGNIPKSFDAFLCDINPHICSRQNRAIIWRNIPIQATYVSPRKFCLDANLPQYTLCLPNIRFESYSIISIVSVDGWRKPLKKIVLNSHGCDKFDEGCIGLIRSLNPKLEREFETSGRGLRLGFTGRVRIPADAYRIVIPYSDEQERATIEETINGLIQKRAAELKTTRNNISISITYPLGRARPEGGRIFSEPIQGYTKPLIVMNYPYRDEVSERELLDKHMALVAVGIWDQRIDDTHCDLNGDPRVIYSINTQIPVSEPPPQPTMSCGAQQAVNYRPRDRYDHGTGVAGLLSAKLNNQGIAGIVPGMQISAWELIDGEQFNAAGQANPVLLPYRTWGIDAKVINFSESFEAIDQLNRLESMLFGGTPNTDGVTAVRLVVAAAGETTLVTGDRKGEELNVVGANCHIIPACWSNQIDHQNRALISVVGLNTDGTDILRNPDGTAATNYGTAFDVAAVGDVVTLLHGGWTGRMQGSSFAAPFVTGLAALILDKAQDDNVRVDPLELKHRILASADDLPSIRRYSRFGRINFDKALRFADDLIKVQIPLEDCVSPPCWKSIEINRGLRALYFKIKDGNDPDGYSTPDKIAFKDIRSVRSDDGESFTIVHNDRGRLRRLTDADIEVSTPNPRNVEKVVKVGGVWLPLDLHSLRELLPCSFYTRCKKWG
jgi:hypothetical protein